MATDNFLDKKSVLGLAERVPMCPPPEILVLSDDISWNFRSITTPSSKQEQYADNISLSLIENYEIVIKSAVGQNIVCKIPITISGDKYVSYLNLIKQESEVTTNLVQKITKITVNGTTRLDDYFIGVKLQYIETKLSTAITQEAACSCLIG